MSTPPPNMPRVRAHAVGPRAIEQAAEPSPSELAEALFQATQTLKSTGRDCVEEAGPELRAISMARGRVLDVVGQVAAEEGGASTAAGTPRGRHRFHGALGAHAERGRVRMGDLAQALGMTARNMTTIVDGLEREGLLARRPHPTDRRAILLELTERGRAHIAQIHALHRTIAERFFAPLDTAERKELLRLLVKICGGVGECDHAQTP